MKRWTRATVAAFGLVVLVAAFAPAGSAQVHGTPSSVTSPGFGGRAINGVPSSVTSLGPRGFAHAPGAPFRTTVVEHRNDGTPHRHHRTPIIGEVYAVPVPVAVPADSYAGDDAANNADDADDQGGPTIFDRRGAGADSYVPPVENAPAAHMMRHADDDPGAQDPPVASTPTLLVFKDRHTIEVGNYAILGSTLFDLTPGHARRIALADLDLDATQKENDDRGVTFQLPPTARAN